MARNQKRMYIGVGSHVVAIDPTTGNELWRTKLKTSQFVTISVSERNIFAGAGGELFCLDATTGEILWRNKLKGLGWGLVSFGSPSDVAAAAAIAAAQAAAAAGGGASAACS